MLKFAQQDILGGNLISRMGGVITTYLGGAQIDDSIKASLYVFTALCMVVIAFVMPRGVMTGSGPSEAESSPEANVIYVEGGQNIDGYGARASTVFCGDSNQVSKTTSRQVPRGYFICPAEHVAKNRLAACAASAVEDSFHSIAFTDAHPYLGDGDRFKSATSTLGKKFWCTAVTTAAGERESAFSARALDRTSDAFIAALKRHERVSPA